MKGLADDGNRLDDITRSLEILMQRMDALRILVAAEDRPGDTVTGTGANRTVSALRLESIIQLHASILSFQRQAGLVTKPNARAATYLKSDATWFSLLDFTKSAVDDTPVGGATLTEFAPRTLSKIAPLESSSSPQMQNGLAEKR